MYGNFRPNSYPPCSVHEVLKPLWQERDIHVRWSARPSAGNTVRAHDPNDSRFRLNPLGGLGD